MKSECTAMDSTRSAAIKNHETFLWRARSELESRSTAPVTARSLCLSLCRHLFLWAEGNLESDEDRCPTCEAPVSRSEDDTLQNVAVACI